MALSEHPVADFCGGHFAYGFLGLGALAAAPAFAGTGAERTLRRLLQALGVVLLVEPVALVARIDLLLYLMILVMSLLLPVTTGLAARFFHRIVVQTTAQGGAARAG